MQIVDIALSEYTQYSDDPLYGIQSLYWPIYCFYKDHSQQAHYHLIYDSSTDLQRVVDMNSINFYSSYGIDFRKNAEFFTGTRRFVVYHTFDTLLDDEKYEHLRNTYSEIEKEDVGLVFLEFPDDFDIATLPYEHKVTISARVQELYPSAFIANSGINVIEHVTVLSKPVMKNTVKFDDIAQKDDIFGDIQSMNRTTVLLTAMLRVIDLVGKTKADMIDASESSILSNFSYGNRVEIMYICLMKFSKLVYFDQYSASILHGVQQKMMKQASMYADDYLNSLANLPDVAVYDVTEPILVFPDKNRDKYHDVRIHVLTCEIDLKNRHLAQDVITAVYYYPDIKMYSTAALFNLSSTDINTAMQGDKDLFNLCKQLTTRCMTEIDISEVLMNVSNVIFYNLDGKDYMAYITNVVTDIPFVAYPIRPQSISFRMRIDLTKDVLYDIRMYDDWRETIYPYVKAGLINPKNAFFRPVRYLRGLCLDGLFTDSTLLDKNVGLTYEEAGMCSNQTWSLRNSKKILNYIKRDCVVERMSSSFGGLHPMISKTVVIHREDWRSKRDRLQKQNTYGY